MRRARWVRGAPAMKKRVLVVRTMMMAVPMSGSTMTRPPTTLTMSTKGTSPRVNLLMFSWRPASQAEM